MCTFLHLLLTCVTCYCKPEGRYLSVETSGHYIRQRADSDQYLSRLEVLFSFDHFNNGQQWKQVCKCQNGLRLTMKLASLHQLEADCLENSRLSPIGFVLNE